MKKIALCFLVTKDLYNLNLWEEWLKGNEDKYSIYVHFSNSKNITQDLLIKNRVTPVPTQWGDISLVKAEKNIYKKAMKNKENKFFILLSESCIPVRNFNYVYRRLMRNIKKGILTYRNIGAYDNPEDIVPFISKKECINLMYKFEFIDKDMYASDQWKILSRNNVNDFFEMFTNKNYVKLFEKFCIAIIPDSLAPDELMYINYLVYKYGKRFKKQIRNRTVTYVDFEDDAIHAIAFKDITPILKEDICYSNAMFARKFMEKNEKKILTKIPLKC